jgi:hypothetical protein
MNVRAFYRAGLAGSALTAVCGLGIEQAKALPPKTASFLYQSGYNVSGVGQVNSPFFGGFNGGEGFRGLAINNSSTSFVTVGIFADPGFNRAVLDSRLSPVPFMAAGIESPFSGSIALPSIEYTLVEVFSSAVNSNHDAAFIVRVGPEEFTSVPVTTGVFFNKDAMPIREGDPVTAAGVSPGTTFAEFDASSVVHITDGNLLLLGCRIIEKGIPKNALLKVQLDGSGNLVSQTLVAKVGGPAAGGPGTWESLAVGPHTCAINNAGTVIYSGETSGGVNGVWRDNTLVASEGGTSPASGLPWGYMFGVPVDINASGSWALRGPVIGATSTWAEQGEAGETFTSGGGGTTGNVPLGGGPLDLITGSLSSDHDVDVYYIRVGDPALPQQEPFSVTTVPNPGEGFDGAAFDTVLHLFRDAANANGATRVGLGRCDDVSPGVQQSTLTAASLNFSHAPGGTYFLAISTPKARPLASGAQMWQDDPAAIAVADGKVFWVDPSEGQIKGADTTTGAMITPLQVGVIPPQTQGQIEEDAPLLGSFIAADHDGANSKLYFLEKRFFPWRIKRCNLDGTQLETVRASGDPGPSIGAMLTFAVDSVNNTMWWSRPEENGTINRCDLDGQNAQTIISLESTRATSLAVDGIGGKVYWHEPVANSLNRCNLDGTGFQILGFPLQVRSIATDVPGRVLYLSMTNGTIRRYSLDTSSFLPDLTSSNAAAGLAADPDSGTLYWTNGIERGIRRTAIAVPAVENWLSVGPDVGERPADGPGYLGAFGNWQKNGTPVATPLPYQIKLTGATFVNQLTVVARDNTKVVISGDVLPSTAPDPVTTIGGLESPVKISDNGLVAWRGRWTSTVSGQTGTRTALFMNTEEVIRDNGQPTGGGAELGGVTVSRYGFDMSPSGQYLVANTFNGSFFGGAGNRCVLVSFDSVPPGACPADFDGNGSVGVPDIFAFLAAWFAQGAGADFNGDSVVSVPDIFAFLAAWFAGCP